MPLIDCKKLVKIAIKLDKGGRKVHGFFAKQKDKDSGIIVENICSYVVKKFPKVFIGFQHFLKPKHTVFNTNLIVILQNIKSESAYIAEIIEVDWFEFILEDAYNFFLWKACKLESDACNFRRDLTGDIIFFCR